MALNCHYHLCITSTRPHLLFLPGNSLALNLVTTTLTYFSTIPDFLIQYHSSSHGTYHMLCLNPQRHRTTTSDCLCTSPSTLSRQDKMWHYYCSFSSQSQASAHWSLLLFLTLCQTLISLAMTHLDISFLGLKLISLCEFCLFWRLN